MSGSARRRRRRAGRVVVAATAVLSVGTAAAAATGFGVENVLGRSDEGTDTAGALPAATGQVTRQTLVDVITETGELGYGDPVTMKARTGGTVTALTAAEATVSRGQVLCRIDDVPVLLLYGTLPAYRDLRTGVEGADVEQFERNLYALGYRGFTVDDEFSSATATAVAEWQEDLGIAETGRIELGRVVYAAGPVRIESHDVAVGDGVQPGAAVLEYTGNARLVTVGLDLSDSRLAKVGAAVRVELPDGRVVAGKVAGRKTVVEPSSGGGGGGGDEPETVLDVTVTVTDEKALAGFDQATVKVRFTSSQRPNVLTVPIAALLALTEGGYGVEVVDGGSTRIVAVETGLFADGRVEVSGDGLTEGMTVGMPA